MKEQSITYKLSSSTSQWGLVWREFRKRRLGMIGLITLLLVFLLVIVVPILFPNPYPDVNPDPTLWYATVGAADHNNGHIFILGADRLGRDNSALLFKAGQFSLLVAFVPSIFILVIGFTFGAISGYFGGWIDIILMQVTDFFLVLPLLPASIIVVGLLTDSSFFKNSPHEWIGILLALITAFTLFGWMGSCRLVRALILSLRTQNFLEAAQALGASTFRIIFRHVLPNISSVLFVAFTLSVGDFAVLETILAYFGLGIHDSQDTSVSSLGTLLASNTDLIWYVTDFNPFKDIRGYLILFPIAFLLVIVVSINLIGDALRDVLDPRSHI